MKKIIAFLVAFSTLFLSSCVQKDLIDNFSISELIQSIGDNLWNKNKNGEIISNMALSFKNVPVFKMYADRMPKDTMYIKGFYGAQYVGGRWLNDGDDFEKAVKEAGFDVEEVKENISLMGKKGIENYYASLSSKELYPVKVTLEYLKKNNKVAYVPYFADVYSGIDIEGGVYYKKEKELTKISYLVNQEKLDHEEYSNMPFVEFKEDWEKWYEEYVCDNYLSVPGGMEGILDIAHELKFKNNLQTLEGVPGENTLRARAAKVVAEWMAKNMNYTLEPPTLPRNAEPIEYFVSVSREGYCMHYASASVMLLREMGVPSRLVTGYVVHKGDFFRAHGGYSAQVMDNQAHAWTEIYLDGLGWFPVEVTKGYQTSTSDTPPVTETTKENTLNSDETGESEEDTTAPDLTIGDATGASEDDTQGSGGEENSEIQGTTQGGNNEPVGGMDPEKLKEIVRRVVLAVSSLLLTMVTIVIVIKLRHEYRDELRRLIRRQKTSLAIRLMNRRIYRKLRMTGKIIRFNLRDDSYGEILKKNYTEIPAEEWERYMELVKAASFSKREFSDEEVKFCYEIYRKVKPHS